MKKILLFLLFFPLAIFSQTPQYTWARTNVINSNAQKTHVTTDGAGNVYVAGTFGAASITIGNVTLYNHETVFGVWDIYMAKYDQAGNLLWARNYGSENNDSVIGITSDAAGNVYLLGTYQLSITLGETTLTTLYPSCFVAKFDSSGEVIWAKSNQDDIGWDAGGIAVDGGGNVYFSGVYYSESLHFGSAVIEYENFVPGSSNVTLPFVVKLDSQGETIWAKGGVRTTNTGVTFANGVTADAQGNVFITGSFSVPAISFGNVTLTKAIANSSNYNMFLLKFDADGNAQWGKNAGSSFLNTTMGYGVAADSDLNVIAVGTFANTVAWDGTTLTAGSGASPYMLKFDASGVLQWAKTVGGTIEPNRFTQVRTDGNSNIYVCGNTGSEYENFGNGVVISTTVANAGSSYLAKYNSSGNAVWVQRAGKIAQFNASSFAIVSENEFYLSGTYTESQIQFGSIGLTKNPQTNYNLFLARMLHVPLDVAAVDAAAMKIYPNPTSGLVFVSDPDEIASYALFDAVGRIVAQGELTGDSSAVDLSGLPSGIYNLKLLKAGGISSAQKIVRR